MRHLVFLLLSALTTTSGCARWAYAPTWEKSQRDEGVALHYDGGPICGRLSVANETAEPITVEWGRIRTELPSGTRRETKPWEAEGQKPLSGNHVVAPGGQLEGGLCTNLRLFVVKPRPLTGYDIALGWFFGTGILAGNVAWHPDEKKCRRVVPKPRQYGWDLVVPVRGIAETHELRLPVRGDGVTAFKYTSWAHGEPDPLEAAR